MQISLEKENQILLACSRSKLDDKLRGSITRLAKSDISWDKLIRLASHHKLLPLLYKHLSEVCPELLPTNTREKLRGYYRYNSLENLKKMGALNQIHLLFASHGIQSLAIKGPLFTLQYLGDISLRTFCDIDILVRIEDFEKATKLLLTNGYSCIPPKIPYNYFISFARLHHHCCLQDSNNVVVELHWRLNSYYGNTPLIWENFLPFLYEFNLSGCNVATLCPELTLIYLSIHAQMHRWQRYDYLLCVSELINATPILNWDYITEISKKFDVEKLVKLAVFMAREVLGVKDAVGVCWTTTDIHSLTEATEKHRLIWQAINNRVVENIPNDHQNRRVTYPLPLLCTLGVNSVIQRYFRQYFCPEVTDWEKLPVPYAFRAIYYFTHPMYKLSRFFMSLA